MSQSSEEKAVVIGNSRTELKNRLLEARAVLKSDEKKRFGVGTFDFKRKCLVSDDGKMELAWLIRAFPLKPIAYDNQQTSRGAVRYRSRKK